MAWLLLGIAVPCLDLFCEFTKSRRCLQPSVFWLLVNWTWSIHVFRALWRQVTPFTHILGSCVFGIHFVSCCTSEELRDVLWLTRAEIGFWIFSSLTMKVSVLVSVQGVRNIIHQIKTRFTFELGILKMNA